MLQKIKVLSLLSCMALMLQACHQNETDDIAAAPRQLLQVNNTVYKGLRADPGINALFVGAGITKPGDEPCDVRIHRMSYNTVGGKGESVTSSGVFMLPKGDAPKCKGPLPVVLHAHGTSDHKNYDLSRLDLLLSNPANPNPATKEAMLLLANFASQGYAVIAPNYAGYSDSSLDYHPYVDRLQQPAEMIDALNHVREHAGILGADLSSELFISGISQGGYVAMATHKALEASGEKVSASLPVSGPYAMLEFLDKVMEGYVNGGATIFAPMYLTALERSADIYDDPSEVYASAYAGIAENSLPAIGGFAATSLPPTALFSGKPPVDASVLNQLGFGDNHLLSDTFRANYLADVAANPAKPVYKIRAEAKKADLRDWTPAAPVMMCGADNDPVVYHQNANTMAEYWSAQVAAGLVFNLDLTDTPTEPFKPVMAAFQAANFDPAAVHSATGVYCLGAGLRYFNLLRSKPSANVTVQ